MKKIKIDGKTVTVDDNDYFYIKDYKWRISSAGYPRATITPKKYRKGKSFSWGFRGKRMFMHQFILQLHKISPPKLRSGFVTDHIDGNPLNNIKQNIRIVSCRHNIANSKIKNIDKFSKYKGVSYCTAENRRKRWVAACEFDSKRITIGRYKTEKEAAIAYNKTAKKLWGKYARLNIL